MEGASNQNIYGNSMISANNSNSKSNGGGAGGTNGNGSSSHHLWQQMNQMPKFSNTHIYSGKVH